MASSPLDSLVLSKIDDLTYSVSFPRPLLSPPPWDEAFSVSVEGLSLDLHYQVSFLPLSDSQKLIIKFKFFVSFENKKISVKYSPKMLTSKLRKSESPSTDSLPYLHLTQVHVIAFTLNDAQFRDWAILGYKIHPFIKY